MISSAISFLAEARFPSLGIEPMIAHAGIVVGAGALSRRIVKGTLRKTLSARKATLARAVSAVMGPSNTLKLCGIPSGEVSWRDLPHTVVHTEKVEPSGTPGTIHGSIHWKFQNDQDFAHLDGGRLFPETFVLQLDKGVSSNLGFHFTARGERIVCGTELWTMNDFSRVDEMHVRLPITQVDGTVAALPSYGDGNYFHWLFDVIPRFHLLKLSGVVPERWFVPCKSSFQRATLELLGVESDKVINASETAFIEARKLIIPSLPGVPGVVPGWVCEFLRESFLPPAATADGESDMPKRLMILRSNDGYRRIVNEAELVRTVERLGFICVRPEKLSFVEQVRLFQNATMVVSPHGAGLSNLVFCAPETRVLEIFAPSYVNICYWDLSQQLRLRYSYLIGKGDQGASGVDPQGLADDIAVDLAELERAIAALD